MSITRGRVTFAISHLASLAKQLEFEVRTSKVLSGSEKKIDSILIVDYAQLWTACTIRSSPQLIVLYSSLPELPDVFHLAN